VFASKNTWIFDHVNAGCISSMATTGKRLLRRLGGIHIPAKINGGKLS
jgi:hypothetical protein